MNMNFRIVILSASKYFFKCSMGWKVSIYKGIVEWNLVHQIIKYNLLCIWYLSAYSGSWGVWTFYLIYIIFKGGFSEYPITISHKLWKRQPAEGKYSKTRFFKNTWKHVGYLFQIQCNTMNKLKVHYLRVFFTVITYIILKVKQFWWQTFEKKT